MDYHGWHRVLPVLVAVLIQCTVYIQVSTELFRHIDHNCNRFDSEIVCNRQVCRSGVFLFVGIVDHTGSP